MLTLSQLHTEFAIISSLNPNFKKFYTHELSQQEIFDLISVVKPNFSFQKYQAYREFVFYSEYLKYCEEELFKLKNILSDNTDLEGNKIKLWILANEEAFSEKLYSLLIANNDELPYFNLSNIGEKLEKTNFQTQLKFCEVMDIIYIREYHQPQNDWQIPQQKMYYYKEPEQNAISDIEKVMQILKI